MEINKTKGVKYYEKYLCQKTPKNKQKNPADLRRVNIRRVEICKILAQGCFLTHSHPHKLVDMKVLPEQGKPYGRAASAAIQGGSFIL